MEMKDLFEKVMQKSINMALATSVDNKPNVRVVTFAYDPARAGKVFFTTFNRNQKVKEFAENPYVACMPIPESPEGDAQVRIFGTVQKSSVSLDEIIAIMSDATDNTRQLIYSAASQEHFEAMHGFLGKFGELA